jgi:ParB/RepB/Spo0J family partition protein
MNQTPTRLKHVAESTRDQHLIDPRKIAIEKNWNPRNYHLPENRAHLDELKSSIRANGTIVPLLVRWDTEAKQAVLVDGECRLRANLELIEEGVEILAVPTVQVPGGNEADRLITSLTANTGKPLSKWEIGTAFQRLIGFGWTAEKIAERLGYSARYVNESLELSDAPEDVKQLLSEQAVTPSLALQHIRTDGAGAGVKLKEKVATARAKSAGKKGKVTAKRERKEKGVRLTDAEAGKILKALKRAAAGKEPLASYADEFKDALELLTTACSRGK